MLDKVNSSFEQGLERIKWFSKTLSERLKVEIAMLKLMREAKELQGRRDSLMKTVGERVFEIRARDPRFLDDDQIRRTVSELDGVERELQDIKRRAADLGRIED